jgi:ipoprotein LpqH
MKTTLAVVAAGLLALGLTGCSSPSAPPREPGTLAEGTATVTVNGTDLGTLKSVSCRHDEFFTTIRIGQGDAGTTSVVNNAKDLVVNSVEIQNFGGFTGSYWQDLQGTAKATQTGRTYAITGEASGFAAQKPNQVSTTSFDIKVGC